MTVIEHIKGRPVYAGGTSSVNIRENVTTDSAVIGNMAAGRLLGTATGNLFPDLERGRYNWYEITTATGRLGYVREDVAVFSAPAKPASSGSASVPGSGAYLKTAFDTENGGLPKWAVAAMAVCFVLVGVSLYFIIKKRKGKK